MEADREERREDRRDARNIRTIQHRDRRLAFYVGIALIIVLLGVALLVPQPTPFQEGIIRIVLALGGAAFGGLLSGSIVAEWSAKHPLGEWVVRGSGALAVFLVIYFWNPVSLLTRPTGPEPRATTTAPPIPTASP